VLTESAVFESLASEAGYYGRKEMEMAKPNRNECLCATSCGPTLTHSEFDEVAKLLAWIVCNSDQQNRMLYESESHNASNEPSPELAE
jgi:hypothetical protein